MKKSFLAILVAVCTLVVASASAQQRNRPAGWDSDGNRPTAEQIARMRTERMTEALSLDEAQAKAVYEQNLLMAEQQQRMVELHRENVVRMKQILNAEQYAKWQNMHQKHRKHRGHMRPKGSECTGTAEACGEMPGSPKKKCAKGPRAERGVRSAE